MNVFFVSLGMSLGIFFGWQYLFKNLQKDKNNFNRAIVRLLIAATIFLIAGLTILHFAPKAPSP